MLDRLALQHPGLFVMHRPGKLGIGTAHLDGIAWAYERGYETLITMDCDFTHSPEDIPRLLEASADAVIVVGSRFRNANSLPGWNPLRRALTRLGHVLTRRLLGMPLRRHRGLPRLPARPHSPRLLRPGHRARLRLLLREPLHRDAEQRLRNHEVDIVLPARTYGHSKMSMREASRSVKQLVDLYLKRATDPAHFRLPPEPPALDPKLSDPQGWDDYWQAKQDAGSLAYDVVATGTATW